MATSYLTELLIYVHILDGFIIDGENLRTSVLRIPSGYNGEGSSGGRTFPSHRLLMGPRRSLTSLSADISLWLHISASTISCGTGAKKCFSQRVEIIEARDLPSPACIYFVDCRRSPGESPRNRHRCLSGRIERPTARHGVSGGSSVASCDGIYLPD